MILQKDYETLSVKTMSPYVKNAFWKWHIQTTSSIMSNHDSVSSAPIHQQAFFLTKTYRDRETT